MPFMWCSEFSY